MYETRDLVRGWLRKAESDLATLERMLQSPVALDAACFHAQQAAEKLLKAYLIWREVDFPFTHNLSTLLLRCQVCDAEFSSLLTTAERLTPYAIRVRYDPEFWPSADEAQQARAAALTIRHFVLQRLPPDLADEPGEANP